MTRANTLPKVYALSLKTDFESGMSYAEMSRKYEKPVSTLKYHAYKLRLRRKHTGPAPKQWTPEKDEKLQELWADSTVPKTSISNLTGMPWDAVNDRDEILGLGKRPIVYTNNKPFKWKITPWPDDMPMFEDSEKALAEPFNVAQARKLGMAIQSRGRIW